MDNTTLANRVLNISKKGIAGLAVEYDSLSQLSRLCKARYDARNDLAPFLAATGRQLERAKLPHSNRRLHERDYQTYNDPANVSWDLGEGFDGALSLAKNGWLDGVKTLTTSKIEMPLLEESTRAHFARDIAGSRVNVPRFLTGRPDCLDRYTTTAHKKRVIDLVLPVSFSCAVSSSETIKLGQALLSLVKTLQASGFSVGLSVVSVWQQSQRWCQATTVRVKEPTKLLSLADLAFVLVHPAFIRRLMLTSAEVYTSDLCRHFGSGVGKRQEFFKTVQDSFTQRGQTLLDYAPYTSADFSGKSASDHYNGLLDAVKSCVGVSA